MKKAILHSKNALFYKTHRGAHVGDLFMSLIHTCELCQGQSLRVPDRTGAALAEGGPESSSLDALELPPDVDHHVPHALSSTASAFPIARRSEIFHACRKDTVYPQPPQQAPATSSHSTMLSQGPIEEGGASFRNTPAVRLSADSASAAKCCSIRSLRP